MYLEKILDSIAVCTKPEELSNFHKHIEPAVVEQALEVAGTAAIRRCCLIDAEFPLDIESEEEERH